MRSSPLPPPSSVEDVVELMQHIQSRLPVEDAARTSVLSKSWLHAWSTNPTLRFHVHEKEHFKVVDVEFDRTLNRYIRDNIPIERFELDVYIRNGEAASVTENWIRSVATKAASTLQELSLLVELTDATLTLPDEIFSVAENLTKLTVSVTLWQFYHSVWMKTPVNSIINCACLREVVFSGVWISQEVLDGIFSSCTLLEKIHLSLSDRYEDSDGGWKAPNTMIKIKNLARLHEIRIYTKYGDSTDLEINGVPNLRLFRCDLSYGRPFSKYSISLGSSVTELWFGGLLITDKSSLEMIESGFPFLESLTLDMKCWRLPGFHFTCGSLKTLSLMWPPQRLMDVQVYAPKLLDFFLEGNRFPANLSFPVSTLVQTTFKLALNPPVYSSFFLDMRKALMLSTKCNLCVSLANGTKRSSIVNLSDLRTRLPFGISNQV